jgi:hypothetical protein
LAHGNFIFFFSFTHPADDFIVETWKNCIIINYLLFYNAAIETRAKFVTNQSAQMLIKAAIIAAENKVSENSPEVSVHRFEEELVIARLLFAQDDFEVSQFHMRRWKGNFH